MSQAASAFRSLASSNFEPPGASAGAAPPAFEVEKNIGSMAAKSFSSDMRCSRTLPTMPLHPMKPTRSMNSPVRYASLTILGDAPRALAAKFDCNSKRQLSAGENAKCDFDGRRLRWLVRRGHRLRLGLVEVEFAVDCEQRGFHVLLIHGDGAVAARWAPRCGDRVDFIAIGCCFEPLGDVGAGVDP